MRCCKVSMLLSVAMAVGLVHGTIEAQDYPNKPVRLIVPFAAGGGTDFLARELATRLTAALGQMVVVDNRGGAGGTLGMTLAARSTPDGYTLVLGSPGSLSISPHLSKLAYDPFKDLAPIIQATTSPFSLTANIALPVKSVKELIALAKAKPGSLNFGTSGAGATGHLAGEQFKLLTGVDIVHVPYKGSAASTVALIAGEVQLVFQNLPVVLPHARAGKMRILAVGSIERSAIAPDLPTMREAGVPGFEAVTSFGVLAPAKTPQQLIERLNHTLAGILNDAAVSETLRRRGMQTVGGSPNAYADYIHREYDLCGKVIRAANIRVD